jgi:hypothetical protein
VYLLDLDPILLSALSNGAVSTDEQSKEPTATGKKKYAPLKLSLKPPEIKLLFQIEKETFRQSVSAVPTSSNVRVKNEMKIIDSDEDESAAFAREKRPRKALLNLLLSPQNDDSSDDDDKTADQVEVVKNQKDMPLQEQEDDDSSSYDKAVTLIITSSQWAISERERLILVCSDGNRMFEHQIRQKLFDPDPDAVIVKEEPKIRSGDAFDDEDVDEEDSFAGFLSEKNDGSATEKHANDDDEDDDDDDDDYRPQYDENSSDADSVDDSHRSIPMASVSLTSSVIASAVPSEVVVASDATTAAVEPTAVTTVAPVIVRPTQAPNSAIVRACLQDELQPAVSNVLSGVLSDAMVGTLVQPVLEATTNVIVSKYEELFDIFLGGREN